jgi:hypothetical protein
VKGRTVILNGDPWTVVDLAPAAPLAEMVAGLLEDEGFVVQIRGAEAFADVLTHLGTGAAGATLVLVPQDQAEEALALVAATVTDYEGAELEEVLALLADDPHALGWDPGSAGDLVEDDSEEIDRGEDELDEDDRGERARGEDARDEGADAN